MASSMSSCLTNGLVSNMTKMYSMQLVSRVHASSYLNDFSTTREGVSVHHIIITIFLNG